MGKCRNGGVFFALASLLAACGGDDKSEGGQPPVEQDAEVRQLEDVGTPPDGTTNADSGDDEDAGGGTDGGPVDDLGLVRTVEDCESACQVYADCGRLDVWNGTLDACRAACDAGAGPRLPDFFSCVAVSTCDALDQCQPPPPPPATCADVCDALFACEGDTTGLPFSDSAACQAEVCAADAERATDLLRCGEAHVLEDACEVDDFAFCLGEAFYDDCFLACAADAACAGDASVASTWACAVACDEATRSGDPLQRRRDEQRRDCVVAASGNCDAIGRCGAPAVRPIVGDATVEALCAANADCPVFAVETCAETAAAVLPDLADGAIDCLLEHMTAACEDGALYRCFAPAPAADGGCEEHCLVQQLCGTLPDGQSEGACVDACAATLAAGGAAAAELDASFRCDAEATCAEVEACQAAGGPVDLCRSACGRQVECGASADLQGCETACVEGFGTVRRAAERLCAQNAECDQVDLCLPPAPPPCAALCDLLDDCNLEGDVSCVTACDDADYVAPEAFDPRLACHASTARCRERIECEAGDLSGGYACIGYCRARLECNGDTSVEAQRDCLQACGAGPGGADGLVFEAAAECLAGAGLGAECAVLQACLNDAAGDETCDRVCGAQADCGVGFDGDPSACVRACEASLDSADGAADAACTLSAVRRGEGCRAVLTCNDLPVAEPSAACATVCGARAVCGEDLDAYRCEVECDADPTGDAVRAACAERVECAELQLCVDAAGVVPDACAAGCGAVEPCNAFGADGVADDVADCGAQCGASAILEGAETADALGACLSASAEVCTRDAAESCFAVSNADPICVESYDALESCGIADIIQGDRDQYYLDCAANLAADEAGTRMAAQCIIDTAAMAMGDMFACFGVIACFPGLGM